MDLPTITPDGNELIASDGASFTWFLEGEPVAGGTTQTISATQTGYYTVTVTFANGCVKTSEPYFHLSTSIAVDISSNFSISPQPVADALWIRGSHMPGSAMRARIVDQQGRVLLQKALGTDPHASALDVSALAPGSYILLLFGDADRSMGRLRFTVAR